MINKLKKITPKFIWKGMRSTYNIIKYNEFFIRELIGIDNNTVFVIGTINHGNLGDHAINLSVMEFLRNNKKNVNIVQISLGMFLNNYNRLSKHIKNTDIYIPGGGSMGIEWFEFEQMIRIVIEKFPENKIVIFPQTIFYGETAHGSLEFEKSKEIYTKHNNLTICAREETSYEIMKKAYPKNNIILVPDIVIYMKPKLEEKMRDQILLCLREDVEGILTKADKEYISEIADIYIKEGLNIVSTDTVMKRNISNHEREYFVNLKLSEFSKSKVVITDRLHGMIFAAITKTPCVVLSNYNYKIKGVYKWLEHLEYIKFLDTIDNLDMVVRDLLTLEQLSYNNTDLINSFEALRKSI